MASSSPRQARKPTPYPVAAKKTTAAKAGAAKKTSSSSSKRTVGKANSGKTAGNVKKANSGNSSNSSNRPILVLVYSNSCYYCQQLMPTWKEAVPEVRAAGVRVVELDAGQLASTDRAVRDMLARTRYSGSVPHIAMVQPGSQAMMEPYAGNRSTASIVEYALNARA